MLLNISFSIIIPFILLLLADFSESTSYLRGRERRLLRAIAGRFKTNKELVGITYNHQDGSENAFKNIEATLLSREMLQLRFDVPKKKEAKDLAGTICAELNSELVQVLGHTALIYRKAHPPGNVSRLLAEELSKAESNVNDE